MLIRATGDEVQKQVECLLRGIRAEKYVRMHFKPQLKQKKSSTPSLSTKKSPKME